MATKFLRVEDIPRPVLEEFETAVDEVAAGAAARGEKEVAAVHCFSAILAAVDPAEAIRIGQQRATTRPLDEEKVDRGFHIAGDTRDALVATAEALGVKRQQAGRLVLVACAGMLKDTIEAGLAGRSVPLGETDAAPIAAAAS